MEGIRIAEGPESIGIGLIGGHESFSYEKSPGTDIRNRKGPSRVSRGGGRRRKWKDKRRLVFPKKVRIQKRDRSHKENLMMTSSYH